MSQILFTSGKEFEAKVLGDGLSLPNELKVGMFNQDTDNLDKTSVLADITTEPDDTLDYERQTIAIPADVSVYEEAEGDYINWVIEAVTKTFQVSDNEEEVDWYFITVEFDASEQLYWAGSLSQLYDLGMIDELNINEIALKRRGG